MTDHYDILIRKLDRFIRKYYKNQLMRGGIYCLALVVIFFLTVNLLEYFAHFGRFIRTFLFYLYLLSTLWVLHRFILIPLLRLYRFGKMITHEQAARIIGQHFPEVKDRLLNALQLHEMQNITGSQMELIQAGIDQKAAQLRPVPFSQAIDFRKNIRYLKYAAIPLLVLMVILVSAPAVIRDPSYRLLNHQSRFEKPLPFEIKILNESLEAIQHEDFRLTVEVTGDELPSEIMISTEKSEFRCTRLSPTRFCYDFMNIQKDVSFRLTAHRVTTPVFTLRVLPKPMLLSFTATLDYPVYTGSNDETLENKGDLIVPEGTVVTWKFFTRNTDDIHFRLGHEVIPVEKISGNAFEVFRDLRQSATFSVSTSNDFLTNRDSLSYTVQVIPDMYPTITVEEFTDTLLRRRLFFRGLLRDDYGFSRMEFVYSRLDAEGSTVQGNRETIPFLAGQNIQQYFYSFDASSIGLGPGETLEYYFEVWDNDGINGPKSARSVKMILQAPTLNEIREQTEQANESVKASMEEAIREARDLQHDIEELNRKLIDKEEISWEERQQIQNLLDRQATLQQLMESFTEQNEQKALQEKEFSELNPEILEKQKQLEELFRELMENEELRSLFEELQRMLEEVDKNKISEMLEQMKMTNEELEEMLDRNLELFRQLEFEQKLEEAIQRLDHMAREQEKLSEKTGERDTDQEELIREQNELQEQFEEAREDLMELDQMNKAMEFPNTFDPMEEMQQQTGEEINNSLEMLQSQQNKKASRSQKNASQKMSQMAASLFDMQQEMLQQGMMEDMESLREILENLVQLSFDQEELIGDVRRIQMNDPQYLELIQQQKKIEDDFRMVRDSLTALSQRQIMIQPFISKEVSQASRYMEQSVSLLNDRLPDAAASKQQFAMTSLNNLALLLSETLDEMMQSMQMQMQSSGICKSGCPKPGSGKPSVKSIGQMQQQLNQRIQMLKEGKVPGGQSNDSEQGKSRQSMSEQLARLAAEQEAIRNMLRNYASELEKEGGLQESRELNRIAQEMERTETDLVNKMISEETLLRQQEILTRLLESEKAEMQREMEEKRESREAKNIENSNPEDFFEYKILKENEAELLRTIPPKLRPYYREKVNQYFYHFEGLR